MASNFKIFIHRTRESLHLKLIGDLDGSSAAEFIHVLKANCERGINVIINTTELHNIHPFGLEVIKKNLYQISMIKPSLTFIGRNLGTNEAFAHTTMS